MHSSMWRFIFTYTTSM